MKRIVWLMAAFLLPVMIMAQNTLDGVWSGKLLIGQTSITLVVHLAAQPDGTLKCTLDSPDQMAKDIPAVATFSDQGVLDVSVPLIGASYSGEQKGDSIEGYFSRMGQKLPLVLRRGEETLRRPQTPQAPFPYTQQTISFCNEKAGATLVGTLVVPEGAGTNTPVVIMVTGSGLENRDEEIFGHKPFLVIADFLARQGIASLRYDDRTFGESKGGDVKNATTLDFMADALAGIEWLRSLGRFGKVGVIGHSEGGNIAFMLGAKGSVDFVVSMAGVGAKCDEALAAQANSIMKNRGMAQHYSVEEYRQMVLQQLPNAWTRWFLDYDPREDIRLCRCPVFVLNGEKDIQVVASLNIPAIRENLPQGLHNQVKVYSGLNHLFQHCATGDATEYRTIEETISPEVLNDIAEWINSVR